MPHQWPHIGHAFYPDGRGSTFKAHLKSEREQGSCYYNVVVTTRLQIERGRENTGGNTLDTLVIPILVVKPSNPSHV